MLEAVGLMKLCCKGSPLHQIVGTISVMAQETLASQPGAVVPCTHSTGRLQERAGAGGLRCTVSRDGTAPAARQRTRDPSPAVEAVFVPSGCLAPTTAAAG